MSRQYAPCEDHEAVSLLDLSNQVEKPSHLPLTFEDRLPTRKAVVHMVDPTLDEYPWKPWQLTLLPAQNNITTGRTDLAPIFYNR